MFYQKPSDFCEDFNALSKFYEIKCYNAKQSQNSSFLLEARTCILRHPDKPCVDWEGKCVERVCYKMGFTGYEIGYMTLHWLTDWLAGWLAGWLADWLTDWLIDWLTYKRTEQLNDTSTDRLTEWVPNWFHWLYIFHWCIL